MQALIAPPRHELADSPTRAQDLVRALINADDLEVDFGLDLLDLNDQRVRSLQVTAGTVSRGMAQDVHGTCTLELDETLQWGRDRVRPWQSLTSTSIGASARFHLGVFLLSTPERSLLEDATYSVQGYDKLHLLQGQVGDTYTVPQGARYLDAVREAIRGADAGTRVLLDSIAAAKTLPAAMTWPLTETDSATWLRVVNDLLAAVGYRGVWVDQDGWYRSEPYQTPSERAIEWTFDADNPYRSLVAPDRSLTEDVWGVPNWWRILRRCLEVAPREDAGQVTRMNQSLGPASIDKVGRRVRRVVWVDAADQAALVTQAESIVNTDQVVKGVLNLSTAPFPIAGHYDVATFLVAELGPLPVKAVARSWVMPLDGLSDSVWEWEVV